VPELPEVETVARGLREPLAGRSIVSVTYDYPAGLVTPDGPLFMDRIAGQPIRSVNRRGKYVLIQLDPDTLLIHLKMTGRLYVVPDADEADRWVHFNFQLDNAHQLRFSDARKFGRVYLVADHNEITGSLGPEPLEDAFTLDVLRDRLAGRSRLIKPLLLDQGFIAGIGNIYADEALFASGIHPLRRADTLSEEEIARLYTAIRAVLEQGIARQGASINWYRQPDGTRGTAQESLNAYGRTGEPCFRCGTPLERIIVGQRSTHYCPACQR
jgi:formamidopyrimidine-DNA glycosylase